MVLSQPLLSFTLRARLELSKNMGQRTMHGIYATSINDLTICERDLRDAPKATAPAPERPFDTTRTYVIAKAARC